MKKKMSGIIIAFVMVLSMSVSVYSNCDCDDKPYPVGRSIPIEIYETE